ncbi:54S ribosomal protein YmL6, mitochondrial [[Candida] railenensis]|uniref:Large ribosomal subunit protein uL4m n=1 Tax=[Candida] railenensis TaxID=45579 RepID=A0A9P0QVM3_9ASCO|nr:54S ribosomal protein YmL6, mitochondrial [[Candida] railenensis]
MFVRSIRRLATEASTSTLPSATTFNIAKPPQYTLASLRSFPSLEPHSFIPLPASFFDAPLRRDFLWSAVVFEADASRVGSGSVPTKGDKPFSNRKIQPQKGSGRARVGDRNSPIRDNGLKAFGRKAPVDWSTNLPRKIYNRAIQTAFSQQYRDGKLFIIGAGEQSEATTGKLSETDSTIVDFKYGYEEATKQFVECHKMEKLHLLFVTDDLRENLLNSTEYIADKADVVPKEALQVRDILKANRIFIEAPALQWLIGKHSN